MTLILSQPHKAVTPEVVNEYFHVVTGKEALVDAKLFAEVASRYRLNWLGLWSMSIIETGWFTSHLLKTKRNLFGLGAVDSDPKRAASFITYEEAALAGAQHLAVYAGSELVRDLPELRFVLPRTYQLLRWGWFGIISEFGEMGGQTAEGKVKWASNPDHGRQVENLISRVTQYALDVEPEPEPEEPKPEPVNWFAALLLVLRAALPAIGKAFPPIALWAGAIYAVIDILIRLFG